MLDYGTDMRHWWVREYGPKQSEEAQIRGNMGRKAMRNYQFIRDYAWIQFQNRIWDIRTPHDA